MKIIALENFKRRILNILEQKEYDIVLKYLKILKIRFLKIVIWFSTLCGILFLNRINLIRNKSKVIRKLEIGPGDKIIPGFETLNIIGGKDINYVYDASKPLPFEDNTFDLIYASHILEHIPWYKTEKVLKEWTRLLKSGGILEIWVPDGLKICKTFVDWELEEVDRIHKDGWYKFNPRKDPYVWASGRIFSYGDGTGSINHPNWHRAIFTFNYLNHLLKRSGMTDIREIDHSEIRGCDHGWINLGIRGKKP